MKYCILYLVALMAGTIAAAQNPVPFINQPLSPSAALPGGAGFTLTVNGTAFVSGAVVHWNGLSLATNFVSSSQITAIVPASNIVSAGTATIAVTNPGGATSSSLPFEVTIPTNAFGFARRDINSISSPRQLVAGDFNGDGKADLAVNSSSAAVAVLLGNGDGSFVQTSLTVLPQGVSMTVAADVNGDGKLDLIGVGREQGVLNVVAVMLGNGDGTFQPVQTFLADTSNGTLYGSVVAGDFNRDGKLDLALSDTCAVFGGICNPTGSVSILLGNGDGTFQTPGVYTLSVNGGSVVVGDFNEDGKLDIAVAPNQSDPSPSLAILLGNGDGTFEVTYQNGSLQAGQYSTVAADLNHDSVLDLIGLQVGGLNIFGVQLGNGDGTFGAETTFSTLASAYAIAIGDFSGTGNLDVAIGDNDTTSDISLSVGNGDGTFQPRTDFIVNPSQPGNVPVLADFNGDGRLDFAMSTNSVGTATVFLQTTAKLSSYAIDFGAQGLGSPSGVQTVTLTNGGSLNLSIGSITLNGLNAVEFAISSNTCGSNLAPGASCMVGVTFTPQQTGSRSASLTFTDGAAVSPQGVLLVGVGSGTIEFIPSSLDFGAVPVGTTSRVGGFLVMNNGSVVVTIDSVSVSGNGFVIDVAGGECVQGTNIPPGGFCDVSLSFTPNVLGPASGNFSVVANGNTYTAPLSGLGVPDLLEVTISPTSLDFGDFPYSPAVAKSILSLTNTGNLPFMGPPTVAITGDISDFSIGSSGTCEDPMFSFDVGRVCTVEIDFSPASTGVKNGTFVVTGLTNGPQTSNLTGNGIAHNLGLTAMATSVTVDAGQDARYLLSAGDGGIGGTTSFTCTGAPTGAVCTVPSSRLLQAGSATTFYAVVSTTASGSSAWLPESSLHSWMWATLLMAVFVIPTTNRKRRCGSRRFRWLPLLLAGFLVSCGGSGGSSGGSGATPAGTYNLTVTGVMGSTQQSITLQLIVK